jgi:hypothetical protein
MRTAWVGILFLAAAGAHAAETHDVDVKGGRISVTISGPMPERMDERLLLDWVERSAAAVVAGFGRFPVPRVTLRIRIGGPRKAVGSGVTFGGASPSIRMTLGSSVTEADLRSDWVLTHEMTHLAFPDLTSDDRWAEEGLSTYMEPIGRVRVGTLAEDAMWGELMKGIPRGLPDADDGGLHGTGEWGRTYWGGALFWLLADIEIREATGGRYGLPDALRAILDAGGDIRARWTLARTLRVGDAALGVGVLSDLYARHGEERGVVKLPELWQRLGIRGTPRRVRYDDTAPLADIRRAIATVDTASRTPRQNNGS